MAKFCSKECEERGNICDFCFYYIDNSSLIDEECYQGEGKCKLNNEKVNALDGCYKFKCFNLGNGGN